MKQALNRVGAGVSKIAIGALILSAAIVTIAQAPSSPSFAALARAQADEARGDYVSAARDFRLALDASPQTKAALLPIAQGLSDLGQCEDAARAFAKVNSPGSRRASTLLGICWFRTHRFGDAITQLRQAVRVPPTSKDAWIYLARAYAGAGAKDKAISTLKLWMQAHPDDADALYWTGQFYQDLANRTFQAMAATHPHNYLVYETEGVEDRARQQYPQALLAFDKALALAPPDTPGLHFYIGDVYWRTLQFDKAKAELSTELGLNPGHAMANYELGDIYVKDGHPQEAAPLLQKALALNPALVEAHRALGNAYLSEKRYLNALKQFEQVANAEPTDHTIHALLATTDRLLGRLKEAQREAQLSQQLENQTIQHIEKNEVRELNLGAHRTH